MDESMEHYFVDNQSFPISLLTFLEMVTNYSKVPHETDAEIVSTWNKWQNTRMEKQ